jgi:hypothetical protein
METGQLCSSVTVRFAEYRVHAGEPLLATFGLNHVQVCRDAAKVLTECAHIPGIVGVSGRLRRDPVFLTIV